MKQANLQQANDMFFRQLGQSTAPRGREPGAGPSAPVTQPDSENKAPTVSPVTQADAAGKPSAGGHPPSERDRLITEYAARFGKVPHHRMKDETIRQQLAEE